MRFTLNSGREVTLVRLQQELTYYGLLAGRPDPKMGERIIRNALGAAQVFAPKDALPVSLAPEGITLPKVTCIGVFDSGELVKPDSEPYSSLVAVWFQDDFAPPIAEDALAKIKALDWESAAVDWIW